MSSVSPNPGRSDAIVFGLYCDWYCSVDRLGRHVSWNALTNRYQTRILDGFAFEPDVIRHDYDDIRFLLCMHKG